MTDLPTAPTPKTKTPVWIKVALTLSLVLNLGLVGMLAGLATRTMRDGSVVTAAIAALPDKDRSALRREARETFRALRGHAASADARKQLLATLTADEFDAAAFETALAAGRTHLAEMTERMQTRITARVAAMSVEERRVYAAELGERLERRKPPAPRP
jgi:uncharacterized membrane protein